MVFAAFAALVAAWGFLRLPETLHPEYRHDADPQSTSLNAARLVLGNRTSICYTLAMMVMFGTIMAYVGMVQQIFSEVFHRASLMPSMFALCAIFMGMAAFLNSRIVERLGMRLISHTALLVFIAVTGLHVLIAVLGLEQLWTFVVLQSATMACFQLVGVQFRRHGDGAGGRRSRGSPHRLQGFVSTFSGALVGASHRRAVQRHHRAAGGWARCAAGSRASAFVLLAEKGRLFRAHHIRAAIRRFTHSARIEGGEHVN